MVGQSFNDFSVVISDDDSPENLEELLAEYKSRDTFHYLKNEKNIGAEHLVDHWNKLLESADSEFVIIASDDDVYDSSFLAKVDELVAKYPECNLFHVPSRIIDSEGNELMRDSRCEEYMSREAFLEYLLCPGSVLCIGNYVFRTSALKAVGGFVNFPLAWKSDTATQLLLADNGVASASEVLFSFRSSGMNTTSIRGNERVDRLKIKACIEFRNWMLSNGFGRIDSISKRLEGEMRSYNKALGLGEFVDLYRMLLKDSWFNTLRSKVSFVTSYLFFSLGKDETRISHNCA